MTSTEGFVKLKDEDPKTAVEKGDAAPKKKKKRGLFSGFKGLFKFRKSDFDGDKMPPDFVAAEKHWAATLVRKPFDVDEESKEQLDIDPDSGRFVNQTPFPICCGREEMAVLGSGYPLYFEFLEYCCIFMFLAFCISGFYNVYTNVQGSDCSADPK